MRVKLQKKRAGSALVLAFIPGCMAQYQSKFEAKCRSFMNQIFAVAQKTGNEAIDCTTLSSAQEWSFFRLTRGD